MSYILAGYQYVDYTNKEGRNVQGVRLHLICPAAPKSPDHLALQGSEVSTEFVGMDKLRGVSLHVGGSLDVVYGKGYGGRAVVADIVPQIAPDKE